jgi:diguanylate cyclase (GGDEF)-like protein
MVSMRWDGSVLQRRMAGALGPTINRMVRILGLTFSDPIAGLPNHKALGRDLGYLLKRKKKGGISIIYIDLDNFKNLNDDIGHDAGNQVLVEIARRASLELSSLAHDGSHYKIYRVGGDEFVILGLNVEDIQKAALEAFRICCSLTGMYELKTGSFQLGLSAGLRYSEMTLEELNRIAGQAGSGHMVLVDQADTSMRSAKGLNGSDFDLSDLGGGLVVPRLVVMDDASWRRGEEIRRAASSQTFEVKFQPIVAGESGEVAGAEALCSLGEHLPQLEASGRVDSAWEKVLRDSCRALAQLNENGIDPAFTISINLSARQLLEAAVSAHLIVEEYGVDPAQVVFEVTEHEALPTGLTIGGNLVAAMTYLRNAGFGLALDDFTVAHSSLAGLIRFREYFTRIKLDRSLIELLPFSLAAGVAVNHLLAMMKELGLQVVAEGVETQEQKKFLELAGCRLMQGYLFAGSLSVDELAALTSNELTMP